jgi:hypothetical protein
LPVVDEKRQPNWLGSPPEPTISLRYSMPATQVLPAPRLE